MKHIYKSIYVKPVMQLTSVCFDLQIAINSVKGNAGIGYGGGGDPSTGRAKDRESEFEEWMEQEIINESQNQTLWYE